jgi:tetratricopeptide (TPR) repeat protein
MSRVFAFVFVVAAAAAVHQAAVGANGAAAPAPAPSASMPSLTPEQRAVASYNSGIGHKNKGLKFETDAAKASKDREKILAKAKDEYGKALKDFKKALELKPDAYQAFNGMGFALRKTGEPAKALEMYEKALTLAPGFPDAIEYRGEAFLALNRIDDAKAAYLELFAKDRELAGQLMKAMNDWVAKHQSEPAGVDPGVVGELDGWIKERAKVASLTVSMGLASNHAAWR